MSYAALFDQHARGRELSQAQAVLDRPARLTAAAISQLRKTDPRGSSSFAGVSLATFERALAGEAVISARNLSRILAAYKMPIDEKSMVIMEPRRSTVRMTPYTPPIDSLQTPRKEPGKVAKPGPNPSMVRPFTPSESPESAHDLGTWSPGADAGSAQYGPDPEDMRAAPPGALSTNPRIILPPKLLEDFQDHTLEELCSHAGNSSANNVRAAFTPTGDTGPGGYPLGAPTMPAENARQLLRWLKYDPARQLDTSDVAMARRMSRRGRPLTREQQRMQEFHRSFKDQYSQDTSHLDHVPPRDSSVPHVSLNQEGIVRARAAGPAGWLAGQLQVSHDEMSGALDGLATLTPTAIDNLCRMLNCEPDDISIPEDE